MSSECDTANVLGFTDEEFDQLTYGKQQLLDRAAGLIQVDG